MVQGRSDGTGVVGQGGQSNSHQIGPTFSMNTGDVLNDREMQAIVGHLCGGTGHVDLIDAARPTPSTAVLGPQDGSPNGPRDGASTIAVSRSSSSSSSPYPIATVSPPSQRSTTTSITEIGGLEDDGEPPSLDFSDDEAEDPTAQSRRERDIANFGEHHADESNTSGNGHDDHEPRGARASGAESPSLAVMDPCGARASGAESPSLAAIRKDESD